MNTSAGRRPPRWAALLILLLLVLVLGGCSVFRRRKPRAPYKKLSPPIAYELMRDNPEMLVIDLRPPQEYNGATGHVRRARNIPLERLPFRLLEISAFRDDTILLYCRQGDDCGEKGIGVLLASGFENVVLMDGGIDKWIRQGFKTVLPVTGAGQGVRPGLDEEGPVMPAKPGAPPKEITVEPPPPPSPPPLRRAGTVAAVAAVAAPRQIG
jgi:rhodanese-related sulfurtransferase